MTVTLSSVFSSTCFLGKVGERVSLAKHMTASRLSFVSPGIRISRITSVMGPNGLFLTGARSSHIDTWAGPVPQMGLLGTFSLG